MARHGKLQYPRASSLLFWRVRARAPAARALEGEQGHLADPGKGRNSEQNRPATAPRSPPRRSPHRRSESGYPVEPAERPSVLAREIGGPSREQRYPPWTILPKGKDLSAAPSAVLQCSKLPCPRFASVVPVPLPALLLAGHSMVDRSPNGAPNACMERRVHRQD